MEFYEANPIECWKRACAYLLDNGRQTYNLIATFSAAEAEDEMPMEHYNPTLVDANGDDIFDVANTIFPAKTFRNAMNRGLSRAQFYERYLRAHRRTRYKSWGTYFERFIQLGASRTNQLELLIEKRGLWPTNPKAALYLHTTSMEIDPPRTRGGPCLQYVQFCCGGAGRVDLVAVYRNHDYFNKALGNYFGLSRLLNFFCLQGGGNPGNVTCIGIHAFAASAMKQRALVSL